MASLIVASAAAVSASASESGPAGIPAQHAPLRVLAIGNSFSQSLCRYFPAMAASSGEQIEFCNLYIGGCSLSRHADNIKKGAEDSAFAPYAVTWFEAGRPDAPRKFASNIPQMLATQTWNVVTIQQASPGSWNPATYRPAADEVIAEIRRLAPQAEIVVQQTWAYNAADDRIGGASPKWGFDQAGMALRIESAYAALAEAFGFRTIPVGAAVRLRRAALAAEGRVFDPAVLAALKPGEDADLRGDPVGSFWWRDDPKTGAKTFARDTIHLNRSGEYLQALVWLCFLSGRNPESVEYVPKNANFAPDIPAMRAAAAAALREMRAKEGVR
ncbi:MAG: DUF4886 domain-containing protein [Kiritimatiellae bacterium]|nr:DUF4886 domain-containing protein [Kiritimatiellia bacterium]